MLKFLLLWAGVHTLGRLPVTTLYVMADLAGTFAWYASARIRRVTRDHMAHIPKLASSTRARDQAARGCARSVMRYYADLARSAHLSQQDAFDEADAFDGVDHLLGAYDRGRGVVMVSAHVGTPEFLARAAGYLGFEIVVLTEPLHPKRVNDFVHGIRNQPGVRFLPADLHGVRAAIETLCRGGLVAIMCDRDIQGNGRPTPFFGERASMPAGAVEIALRTGAAIVPGFVSRLGPGRCRMRFLPELELAREGERQRNVEAGMLEVARALERGIASAPEQWFVLQPVWRGLPLERPVAGRRGRERTPENPTGRTG